MMRKEVVVDSRQTTMQRWHWTMAVALLAAFISGGILALAVERAGTGAAPGIHAPAPTSQLTAADEVGDMSVMSPREAARYSAFYARQMASEAALERWSLPGPPMPEVSPQQRAFYARQMASEAALERWFIPGQVLSRSATDTRVPRVVDGVQFR